MQIVTLFVGQILGSVYATAQNAAPKFLGGRERPHELFGRLKAEKVGSLPPNLVIFSVSLFSSSCLLFPRFPGTYADHREKKMVKTKLKYVIPTFFTCFVQILTARTERNSCWAGATTSHFGHGTVCKSGVAPAQPWVLPASKLIVAPCATSCYLGTCSSAKVTARVTQMVICVFHAHFTFLRCK
jgi:hypothetical protein